MPPSFGIILLGFFWDTQAVFDLGGNVAEWVMKKDDKGVLRGGSADAPADGKQKKSQAAASYWGFRVLEDPVAR